MKPEQIYLRDAEGNLKLMLGWTMAQFDELVRLRDALEQKSRPPAFAIEEISIAGTAHDQYAELAIRCKVHMFTDAPARIPLGLEQMVLKEVPQRSDGKTVPVVYSKGEGGYLIFLQGKKDSVEEITFQGWVPVVQDGNDRRLLLSVPEVPISQLELEVPSGNATVTVGPGATLLSSDAVEGNVTRVKVAGLGPGFELNWHTERAATTDNPPLVESVGLVIIRATGTGLDFDTRLTVRSYTTPFDRFRIRLPEGASLLPSNTAGYTVVEVSNGTQEAENGKLVEVTFPKKTPGPIDVRLAARRTVNRNTWMDLAGFSVEGAVRQWGYVGIITTGDQTILWGNLESVRQIDKLPGFQESVEPTAAFEYYSLPCAIPIKLVPRTSVLSVTPQYRVDFFASELLLQATLNCDVRGGELAAIDFDTAGWRITEATLRGQDAPLVLSQEDQSRVTIALPQRLTGKIEINLKARRDVVAESQPLELTFPRVNAHQIQPAELVLVAAPNIVVRPLLEKSLGVIAAAISGSNSAVPNVFAWRLTTPEAVLSLDWETRPREVTLETETNVQLEGLQASVEQRMRFHVAYQPWAEPWRLLIPRILEGNVTALLDGRPAELKKAATPGAESGPQPPNGEDASVEYTVTPLTPVLGDSELVLRYAVPSPRAGEDVMAWRLPVIQSPDGRLNRQRVILTLPPGWQVEEIAPPWVPKSPLSSRALARNQVEFETIEPVREALLRLRILEVTGSKTVIVDKMIIQTRMDRNMRQDRCVIEFQTSRDNLILRLPRAVRGDVAQIWLDGQPIRARVSGRSEIMIPLENGDGGSAANQRKSHHLEVWYELPRFRSDWGRTRLELPHLEDPVFLRWMYWEIVLLPDEHIIWTSLPLTMEYQWRWMGYFWGRSPALSEEELEQWAGVNEGWLQVSVQANRYLFSSLRTVTFVDIWTLRRASIVAICSGMVVLLGWGWIYLGRSWRRILTLGLLGVFAVVGLLRPDVALLMAEASALGVALAVLSWFLYRAVTSPEPVRLAPNTWGEPSSMDTIICQRNLSSAPCPVPSPDTVTRTGV